MISQPALKNGCVGGLLVPILILAVNVLGIWADLRRRQRSPVSVLAAPPPNAQ